MPHSTSVKISIFELLYSFRWLELIPAKFELLAHYSEPTIIIKIEIT